MIFWDIAKKSSLTASPRPIFFMQASHDSKRLPTDSHFDINWMAISKVVSTHPYTSPQAIPTSPLWKKSLKLPLGKGCSGCVPVRCVETSFEHQIPGRVTHDAVDLFVRDLLGGEGFHVSVLKKGAHLVVQGIWDEIRDPAMFFGILISHSPLTNPYFMLHVMSLFCCPCKKWWKKWGKTIELLPYQTLVGYNVWNLGLPPFPTRWAQKKQFIDGVK